MYEKARQENKRISNLVLTVTPIYRELRLHYLTLYQLWTVPHPHNLQLPLSLSVSVTNPATSAAEASGTSPSNHTGYPQPRHFSPGTSAAFSGYSPVSSESVTLMGYKTPPQSLPADALPMSNVTSNTFLIRLMRVSIFGAWIYYVCPPGQPCFFNVAEPVRV